MGGCQLILMTVHGRLLQYQINGMEKGYMHNTA